MSSNYKNAVDKVSQETGKKTNRVDRKRKLKVESYEKMCLGLSIETGTFFSSESVCELQLGSVFL